MSIAKNIKMLREVYDLSQKDIGRIAGVSDKAVSTWESGIKEPRMGALQKLADHFGILKSNIIEDGGLNDFLAKKQKAPEGDDNNKELKEIIDLIKKLPPTQWPEVKGFLKHMLYEYEAAETAKQTSSQLA